MNPDPQRKIMLMKCETKEIHSRNNLVLPESDENSPFQRIDELDIGKVKIKIQPVSKKLEKAIKLMTITKKLKETGQQFQISSKSATRIDEQKVNNSFSESNQLIAIKLAQKQFLNSQNPLHIQEYFDQIKQRKKSNPLIVSPRSKQSFKGSMLSNFSPLQTQQSRRPLPTNRHIRSSGKYTNLQEPQQSIYRPSEQIKIIQLNNFFNTKEKLFHRPNSYEMKLPTNNFKFKFKKCSNRFRSRSPQPIQNRPYFRKDDQDYNSILNDFKFSQAHLKRQHIRIGKFIG